MALSTFTNGGTGLQPFGSASGIKMIDNFSSADLTSGPTDPNTGVQLYLVYQVKMYMGGTSGSTGAARLGLWNSATSYYQVANQTINGVAATVSSATALETATLNAVIQSGKTYYAGGWASASLASKRDNATGSFSSYSGNGTSGTVATTYNPGNLYFQILYYYLPSAPGTPTVTSYTSSTATISWTAPSNDGGTAVSGYKVQYSTDATNWTTYTEGSYSATPSTSITITGLTPGQTYYFRVAAKNAVIPGYGTASIGNGTSIVADTAGGFTSGYTSYSDSSGSWIYDSYSSGAFSSASASVKLYGGVYSAGSWNPVKNVTYRAATNMAITSASIITGNPTVTVTVGSTSALKSGDSITITGGAATWFNGTWTISSILSSTQFTYTSTSFTTTASSSGTISIANRNATVKVWNGISWVSYY